MTIPEVMDVLKKHRLLEDAEVRCRQKKISAAPHDSSGHNKVYIELLDRKSSELHNKIHKLREAECSELENISMTIKPTHNDCLLISLSNQTYCETKCKYYDDNIKKLEAANNEIREAIRSLQKDSAAYELGL